jgi:hypothetical protein
MTPEEFAQAIQEFKTIYKEECGVELNNKEATIKAQSLLRLFNCLTQGMEKAVK